MSERIEKLFKDYPGMILKRDRLTYELANFKGLSANEVIASMYAPQSTGERVQTSGTSDKTAQIALNYQSRMERVNLEWFEQLEYELWCLNTEIIFFEAALKTLSGKRPSLMWDMVVGKMTWDALSAKYGVSRTMIAKTRRRAIRELENTYRTRDADELAFILS